MAAFQKCECNTCANSSWQDQEKGEESATQVRATQDRWAGEGRIYQRMRLRLPGAAMSSSHQPSALNPVGIGHSHGSLTIFSAPKIVLTHIQWSLSDVLGKPQEIKWNPQPLALGCFRTQISWSGKLGTGAKLASSLRGWHYLKFEIYEAATSGSDGSLFMFTPELGLFRANIGPHGDIMINEHQLNSAMMNSMKEGRIVDEIEKMLGKSWNESLEPFRRLEIDGVDEMAGKISV
jgi:hypothetical protein